MFPQNFKKYFIHKDYRNMTCGIMYYIGDALGSVEQLLIKKLEVEVRFPQDELFFSQKIFRNKFESVITILKRMKKVDTQ